MRRSPKAEPSTKNQEPRWSLLTPHALVLLCIARAPDTRVKDIAEMVGISERGAHQIVADLVSAKYLQRTRVGRRNRYAIEEKTALRSAPLKHRKVASIIALLGAEPAASSRAVAKARSNAVNGHAKPNGHAKANGHAKTTRRRDTVARA